MKQTFNLIKQSQTQTQKLSLLRNASCIKQQAVAAAYDVRPIAFANVPKNAAFISSGPVRGFAAKLQEVPTMGDSISEGVVQEMVATVGTAVKADEVIARIETDKVTVDILAAFDGVVTKYHCEEGDTVPVGAPFVDIDPQGTASSTPAAAEAPKKEATPEPVKAAQPEPAKPAPTPVAAAPPKPAAAPAAQQVPSSSANMTTVVAKKAPSAIGGQRLETRVPMNRMRQTISRRLKESQNTNASLTTFNEIDMSTIMDSRKQVQDAFIKKHGVKLGFMSAFMKASVQALKEQPVVNAVIDDNQMVYRDFIDISTAVSTPTGLVVPVIRNCQNMGFHDLELNLADLAKRAREGKITIEDMTGGTFTITNGGVFGSMMGTPIINMPQSAILGMHATKLRPTVVGSQILARPIMYVALTYDHRIIDGREAVLFLRKIKESIEDPKTILFDL